VPYPVYKHFLYLPDGCCTKNLSIETQTLHVLIAVELVAWLFIGIPRSLLSFDTFTVANVIILTTELNYTKHMKHEPYFFYSCALKTDD